MYSKNSATWGMFLKVSSNIVRKIEILTILKFKRQEYHRKKCYKPVFQLRSDSSQVAQLAWE